MRYRVSEDAERGLDEIFLYWATRARLEAADRVVDRNTECFWLLGKHPDAGRTAGGIAAGVKCLPAGKYIIYYRKTHHDTHIPHIVHVARNQRSAIKTARARKRR